MNAASARLVLLVVISLTVVTGRMSAAAQAGDCCFHRIHVRAFVRVRAVPVLRWMRHPSVFRL